MVFRLAGFFGVAPGSNIKWNTTFSEYRLTFRHWISVERCRSKADCIPQRCCTTAKVQETFHPDRRCPHCKADPGYSDESP